MVLRSQRVAFSSGAVTTCLCSRLSISSSVTNTICCCASCKRAGKRTATASTTASCLAFIMISAFICRSLGSPSSRLSYNERNVSPPFIASLRRQRNPEPNERFFHREHLLSVLRADSSRFHGANVRPFVVLAQQEWET